MALTERQVVDRIEIVESNHIQVRTATIVENDGVFVSKTFHRRAFFPGEDVSDQTTKVQSIAAAIWTDEVISAYQASLSEE